MEGGPLRRDAERNRQRILDAARPLFARDGVAVSHDQVARAADVGVGTVYRRFPRKQHLLAALLSEQVDRVVALAEGALRGPDPWRGLSDFLEQVLDMQAQDRALRELLLGEFDQAGEPAEVAVDAQQRIAPLMRRLVDAARESGQLRPEITAEDVGLVPVMVSAVVERTGDVAPRLHRRVLAVVLAGMRAGTQAEGSPELPIPGPPLRPDEYAVVMSSATSARRRGAATSG